MAKCCHNSCLKGPPFVCTHAQRCPRRLSIALSMTVWSLCNAKYAENTASVHNTCLDKIVRCFVYKEYLTGT